MTSVCGRFVMVYNGEVYNHGELRSELEAEGTEFRGTSDSEVILAAMALWGIEPALKRFNGMFAIALWDRRERLLTLARDRMGIKPLYYGCQDGTLLFGSELSALRSHPSFKAPINPNALTMLLRHKYIGGEHCIYSGIYKLEPGCIATFKSADATPTIEHWWSAREAAINAAANRISVNDDEVADRLEELLLDSIGRRMVADVPVGAFLSGGIDSSTVVALMQKQCSSKVKTYCIGFREAGFDEAQYARQVAEHLGTDHTEIYVGPEDARNVIPDLPALWNEPFADSSQIPTYLVSKLARQDVIVSLSGDGGDELFGGYRRYGWCNRLSQMGGWMPPPLRRLVACTLTRIPRTESRRLVARAFNKARRLGEVLSMKSDQDLYFMLVSDWQHPDTVVNESQCPTEIFQDDSLRDQFPSLTERMMLIDSMTYLPDDILTKVDRASMAVSLEARVPILDHRIYEFAWTLPLRQRVGPDSGKLPLKNVLARHVPREFFERPKQGFGVPVAEWLRGPLRDWAEELLSERRLQEDGFFNPAPIRRAWALHLAGGMDLSASLWSVLAFQAWYDAR
jgi:asparagine synthase (glutamine-hydrolysing)